MQKNKSVLEKDELSVGKTLSVCDTQEYTSVVSRALSLLDKNIDIIIHGASFPSAQGENTGIGSPFTNGAKNLTLFLKKHGFSGIQLGPEGLLKPFDPSPYMSSLFSKNTLFTDLKRLTMSDRGTLLSESTFSNIVENNPNKDVNKANFGYIFPQVESALREAFDTFKSKVEKLASLSSEDAKVIASMNERFMKFKLERQSLLEKDSIYAALIKKYNNDYWPVWEDAVDKNLFNPKSKEEEILHAKRIEDLKSEYSDEIEFFKFKQFLVSEDKAAVQEFNLANGIKSKADSQVAYSDMDVWANQSIFMDGWYLGCPPDAFSETGQAWGFPVLDPEKLFNQDGSLGDAGKFLYEKFKGIFQENAGGVRIDHVIGLIDPFVYKAGTLPLADTSGRLYSSPENPELAKFARKSIEEYGSIITKIIIPAAKEAGVGKESIICEDLGTLTDPVEEIMETLDLSGIRVTEFFNPKKPKDMYRGINAGSKDYIMPGSHDNSTLIEFVQEIKKDGTIKDHAKFLAEDLLPAGTSKEEKARFSNELVSDANSFIRAKFAELFASPAKQVQVFFTDMFGIKERYNLPGTSGDQNWSLRLPDNFEELYMANLSKDKGLNLPEVLKMAIESKGESFVKANQELVNALGELSAAIKQQKVSISK